MRGLIAIPVLLLASLSGCLGLFDDDFGEFSCERLSQFTQESGGSFGEETSMRFNVPDMTEPMDLSLRLDDGESASVTVYDPLGEKVWAAEATKEDPYHETRIERPEVGRWLAALSREAGHLTFKIEC